MIVLAYDFWTAAKGPSDGVPPALLKAAALLAAFVFGRALSLGLDGPPANNHAHVMTTAEALGAAVGFGLWWKMEGRRTAWGRGLVALFVVRA